MRKSLVLSTLLIAAISFDTAQAADKKKTPNKKAKAPVVNTVTPAVSSPSGVNWSGFYLGMNWGVAKGTTDWSKPTGAATLALTNPSFTRAGDDIGLFAGISAGYNYQTGPWVIGAEADISAANINSNAKCSGSTGFVGYGMSWRCGSETNWIGSLAPRVGYAFGNSLLFAKVGLAYANSDSKLSYPWPNGQREVSKSTSRYGLALGLGYEHNLGGNWSAKAEYAYYNFGSKAFSGSDRDGAVYGASSAPSMNVFKFGLNYRFGGDNSSSSNSAPQIANDISGEFGTRVGWSGGKFAKNLWDYTNKSQLNSRLTWEGQDGLALETFARLDHTSGVFAKGLIGGVGISSSKMSDEDFPPGISPYSKTTDTTKNGRDLYATVDLGYNFLSNNNGKLGAFIGYNHYEQNLRAYGCTQVATNAGCRTNPPPYTSDNLILGENERWNSMRLGLNGEYMITDRLKIMGDAAWLPVSNMTSNDNHWLRANINPLKQVGDSSKNYQLEAVLSYKVTEKVSLGVGARHWHFEASGHTQFPGVAATSPMKFKSDRTTIFTQLSYTFGGEKAAGVLGK